MAYYEIDAGNGVMATISVFRGPGRGGGLHRVGTGERSVDRAQPAGGYGRGSRRLRLGRPRPAVSLRHSARDLAPAAGGAAARTFGGQSIPTRLRWTSCVGRVGPAEKPCAGSVVRVGIHSPPSERRTP